MIKLKKINKSYHTEAISLHALKDIDLEIEPVNTSQLWEPPVPGNPHY